jgi:amidase
MRDPKLQELCEGWLVEATVDEMQEKLQAGELTSRELVLMYLHRIAAYDKQGMTVNSVLEINPEALQIAEALDVERKQKGARGPLHGIPVLIKDNIDTGDNMHTSAGSIALAESVAAQDSFVAKRLREAGAVILGKANMTEWANYMAHDMPSGYSSRGGQVLNPYGPGKVFVGGSSSGTGAAIASNFAAVGVGTETSGSILSPSSQNSLVGIKPTVGLISRAGIIPISHSQDTAGPMTRTVRDSAILLGALTGVDERDAATWASVGAAYEDYTQFLDRDGLKGARVGILRRAFAELPDDQKNLMEAAFDVLRQEGAELVDVELATIDADWDYDVLKYEFKADLNAYLRHLAPHVPVHSLADLVRYNNLHAVKALRHGQHYLLDSEATSGTLTEPAYIESREKDIYLAQKAGLDQMIAEYNLDAWLFPQNGFSGVPAKAGYPSITVPAGYAADGPVGLTFSGLAYSEPVLLRLAYAFEQATLHRVPPKLGITFRRFDLNRDREEICGNFRDTMVAAIGTDEGYNEENYKKRVRELVAQFPDGFVLAEEDGKVVGQLELRIREYEGRKVGFISIFYLKPECRGAGYAQYLTAYAERYFDGLGLTEYHLRVDPSNERAIRFYEKHGLKKLGDEMSGTGHPAHRMGKELKLTK